MGKKLVFSVTCISVFMAFTWLNAMPVQDRLRSPGENQNAIRNSSPRSNGSLAPGHSRPNSHAFSPVPARQNAGSFGPPTRGFGATVQKARPANPAVPKEFEGWLFRTKDNQVVFADLKETLDFNIETKFGNMTINSDDLISLRVIEKVTNDIADKDEGDPSENASQASDEKVTQEVIESNYKVVVATEGGDIISGTSVLGELPIKLKWGTAAINPEEIDFMSLNENGVRTIVQTQQGNRRSWVLGPVQVVERERVIHQAAQMIQIVSPGDFSRSR